MKTCGNGARRPQGRDGVRAPPPIHAALNAGASRQEVAEVICQMVTYGGMPVVVDALNVFKEVLVERGEWTDEAVR